MTLTRPAPVRSGPTPAAGFLCAARAPTDPRMTAIRKGSWGCRDRKGAPRDLSRKCPGSDGPGLRATASSCPQQHDANPGYESGLRSKTRIEQRLRFALDANPSLSVIKPTTPVTRVSWVVCIRGPPLPYPAAPELPPIPSAISSTAPRARATSPLASKEVMDAFGKDDPYGPILTLQQAAAQSRDL
ncbi:MAG: hypothetical protein JWN24_4836 [Phycisphaerales bacterium]|nr:hypothetical protein [Phycisphaerales bacterium]